MRVEKHLFVRQYQTAKGEWSTLYYAVFRDWKKKQRTFPLGAVSLEEARKRLRDLEARDWRHEDFDATAKQAKARGVTFAKWTERYLNLVKMKRSVGRDRQHCEHLNKFFAPLALVDITRAKIAEYKNLRVTQPIIRYGEPVEGTTVKISTVNREISCLRHMLHLAADEGLLETVPKIKLDSEKHLARERVLADEEYATLLEAAPRWLQRIFIAASETALSRGDVLKLTWAEVDRKAGVIRLKVGRAKTGARQVPAISPALREVLDELDAEFKKLPNVENRVFTRQGRPVTVEQLRKGFDLATATAKVEDFTFHDFRHTAITRWAAAGLPIEVALVAAGHKVPGMHGRYTNLQDRDIVEAFKKIYTPFKRQSETRQQEVANYAE